MNVDKQINDAAAQVTQHGDQVMQPIQSSGPHGFRAIALEGEGN